VPIQAALALPLTTSRVLTSVRYIQMSDTQTTPYINMKAVERR
jgi:hypothetical protein